MKQHHAEAPGSAKGGAKAETVALITTGSELLRGRSMDTHLSLISRELEPLGLDIGYHATAPDVRERIVEEIRLASARAGVVILTGGLGPTEDDFTRPAAAEAYGRPLEFSPRTWNAIRARFRRFKTPLAANNRNQAWLPKGARMLPNPLGSAPGFAIETETRRFYALPGPPHEMLPMLRKRVLPHLASLGSPFKVWEGAVYGMPEGSVDERVAPIARRFGAVYGITASGGMIRLSLKLKKGSLAAVEKSVKRSLGIHLIGGPSLERVVAELLLREKRTIAVAESCTGGRIADRLTDVPGISDSLLESWVCYSNESKTARLGVPSGLIRKHGAVSSEVATAMAAGAARVSGADIAAATTGIAGPAGGSRLKPVGLVWHAVHYKGRTRTEKRVFPGDRASVKMRATNLALDLVRRTLLNA